MPTVEMAYSADYEILLVTVAGKYSISKDTEVAETVISELLEKKCTKCIVDYRNADFSAETLPTIERSDFYKTQNIPKSITLAAVFKEQSNDARFLETVLRNRGWAIRIFTDFDKAMEWIADKRITPAKAD